MTRLSFQFEMVAADDPKTNVKLITSITDEEKQKFEVPRHLGIRKYHTQLETLPEYKKVTATPKRRGQTRSVWFNLNKEILRDYVNDNGNMAIGDYLLEEIKQEEHKSFATSQNHVTSVSFVTALNIGTKRKQVTDSEFLKNAFINCSELLFNDFTNKKQITDRIKEMPLSARTVQRRVEDMAKNIERHVKSDLLPCNIISIAIDETTNINSIGKHAIIISFTSINRLNVNEEPKLVLRLN
ncbi:hypothetical protein M0802_013671 [Mischocyttarus mexicanus]|nr:hypothetical protein M0802_013671 [Mischocyttarus mexicanus]